MTVTTRPLHYLRQEVTQQDGSKVFEFIGNEKGIDIRIALDAIRLALEKQYEVALIFSQDQDLSEVALELQRIAKNQDRWIKVASAYPQSPNSIHTRGINYTQWIPIPRETYDRCVDPCTYGYRSRKSS